MTGWTYSGKRGVLTSVTIGALTGGITGGFGIPGGPFMIIYFLSAPVGPPIQRANIIVSAAIGMIFLLAGLIVEDAYTRDTLLRSIAIVPIFVAGSWVGRYLFKIAPVVWFKKVNYTILIATDIMALAV